jgi:hypothetical protein
MLTPADRHSITLLNCDYRILILIRARRLRPLLALHPKATQYCGVPGNTIFDDVATVRTSLLTPNMRSCQCAYSPCIFNMRLADCPMNTYHSSQLRPPHSLRHFDSGTICRGYVNGANEWPLTRPILHALWCPRGVSFKHGFVYPMPPPLPHRPGTSPSESTLRPGLYAGLCSYLCRRWYILSHVGLSYLDGGGCHSPI